MSPAEIAGAPDRAKIFPAQSHGKSDATNERFTATKRRATNSGLTNRHQIGNERETPKRRGTRHGTDDVKMAESGFES